MGSPCLIKDRKYATAASLEHSGKRFGEAGVIPARGGKVRLISRNEMKEDWDPATDRRLQGRLTLYNKCNTFS